MEKAIKVSTDLLKEIVWANFLDKATRDEETRFTAAEVVEMIGIAEEITYENNYRRS